MKKKTRYVLLGLLREEALTGYELKKIIDIRMSFFWQESYGQIYPELNKLLKEGYIKESNDKENEQSKREKVKYQITSKGKDLLKQWMEAENEKETVRSEFLLKMFLSTNKNYDEMLKHVEAFCNQSQSQLKLYQAFENELIGNIDTHENHRQILDVLSLGIKQQELYATWSKDMIAKINERNKRKISYSEC